MDDDIITTFNDGDALDILGNIKAHMAAAYNSDLDSYVDCLNDAFHAIERLQRERDAAIADLNETYGCDYCKYLELSRMDEPCLSCDVGAGENRWEWRGVQE